MFIKVCGLTGIEEAEWAVELGYTAFGAVLHRESVRFCGEDMARRLAAFGKGKITTVAVAVKYDELKGVAGDFDYIQVYEEVNQRNLIYAGISPPSDIDYSYFLYDKSRGSGVQEDMPDWPFEIKERLIIAGGLTPRNVRRIIKKHKPSGVDVSSGVEIRRGVKDYKLMKEFIYEVRNALQ